jgi:hypothetical protein
MNKKYIYKLSNKIKEAIYEICWNNSVLDNHISCFDFSGACAIASFALSNKLRKDGFTAEMVLGKHISQLNLEESHCWVQLNGLIIDPTYSQFSNKKQIIFNNDKYHVPEIINPNKKDFKNWRLQNPYKYSYIWFDDALFLELKDTK